jgi:hypothetical protein
MADIKTVIHISHNIPYSRAEFFTALTAFTDAGIEVVKVNRARQEIWTRNVYVRFMTRHCDLAGYHIDEIFGIRNQFNEYRLKDRTKPRYSGSLVEYVKKLEENAVTDAFLEKELDKIRKE